MYNKHIMLIIRTDKIKKCITYLNYHKQANFYFMEKW